MRIYIGCDHRGVEIENGIKTYLEENGFEVVTSSLPHSDTDDYCDFAFDVCKNIINNKDSMGILLCGTGIGMSIAANKVKGIRAARCVSEDDAFFSRCHNDANVLCLGINNTNLDNLTKIIDTFLNSKKPFEERHINRVNKIIKFESES